MPAKAAKRCQGHARQKGAEIVEFLLTLPVILIVLAILFDFGALFSDQIILTNAARAAAREVINGASDVEAQQASDRITLSLISDGMSVPPTVTVVRAGPNPGDQVTVTVDHVFTFFLLPSIASTAADINLASTVRMNMLPN